MYSCWPDDTDRGVVDGQFFVLLKGLAQRVQTMPDKVFQVAWQGEGRVSVPSFLHSTNLERTVHEVLVILLQIRLRALASRPNRHRIILVRVSGGGELIQMRTGLVATNHEETDPVGATTVLLCVDLSLYKSAQYVRNRKWTSKMSLTVRDRRDQPIDWNRTVESHARRHGL